ncbi:protein jim lovell [Trichogramma pretiosum]|uniref:protein jim lovell n=1 Tax=Trichogramma pretiosum TaxID=7493 RepID=UPI0006C97E4C|nr:protein jim lovell [Trichogramma pretiosum]
MSSRTGSTVESTSGYSLRWHNHQLHITKAFGALLHADNDTLVDVTLVCANGSLGAHKIILSACSPFFAKIFENHPCKHPVIVLDDFSVNEINIIMEFMYLGEVRIEHSDLPGVLQAASSLQIRGLTSSEVQLTRNTSSPISADSLADEPLTPEEEAAHQQLLADDGDDEELPTPESDRDLIHRGQDCSRDTSASPLMARRKQARPRRRSDDQPQDLSRTKSSERLEDDLDAAIQNRKSPSNGFVVDPSIRRPSSPRVNSSTDAETISEKQASTHDKQQHTTDQQQQQQQLQQQQEEEAENLSMKKELNQIFSPTLSIDLLKTESETTNSPRTSPLMGNHTFSPNGPYMNMPVPGMAAMSSLALTPPHHPNNEYLSSLSQLAAQWLPPNQHNHMSGGGVATPRLPRPDEVKPPAGFPFAPCGSPIGHRSFLAGQEPAMNGLFHGLPMEGYQDGFKPETFHGLFAASLGVPPPPAPPRKKSKKQRSSEAGGGGGGSSGRRWCSQQQVRPLNKPKGQHSAPRGGPPRSWTNNELTEALSAVWRKTMTTSQASRTYGIPYNSLLMYVRGKYGKSLKLEQLRHDCSTRELVLAHNNNTKSMQAPGPSKQQQQQQQQQSLGGPGGVTDAEAAAAYSHHANMPLLSGGVSQGFYPDFANFSLAVNMAQMLQSEVGGGQSSGGGGGAANGERRMGGGPVALPPGASRSPSPAPEPEQLTAVETEMKLFKVSVVGQRPLETEIAF